MEPRRPPFIASPDLTPSETLELGKENKVMDRMKFVKCQRAEAEIDKKPLQVLLSLPSFSGPAWIWNTALRKPQAADLWNLATHNCSILPAESMSLMLEVGHLQFPSPPPPDER